MPDGFFARCLHVLKSRPVPGLILILLPAVFVLDFRPQVEAAVAAASQRSLSHVDVGAATLAAASQSPPPHVDASAAALTAANQSPSVKKDRCWQSKITKAPTGDEWKWLDVARQAAITEIRLRLEEEHTLFTLRFTLIGAVLGLLIYGSRAQLARIAFATHGVSTQSSQATDTSVRPRASVMRSSAEIVIWSAVFVSLAVDIRMHFSVTVIHELGCWVLSVDREMLVSGIESWESWIANNLRGSSWMSSFLFLDRALLSWLLYGVAVYVFVIRREDSKSGVRLLTTLVFVPASLALFSVFSAYYYLKVPEFGATFALATLVICLLGIGLAWLAGQSAAPPPDHASTEAQVPPTKDLEGSHGRSSNLV